MFFSLQESPFYFFFIFIKDLNFDRFRCHSPSTYSQEALLHLFFFDKKLRFASASFQFFDRNRKPAEVLVRHICINGKFLKAFQ